MTSGMGMSETPIKTSKKTKYLEYKIIWTMCIEFDNHSYLICQHTWEDLYDH